MPRPAGHAGLNGLNEHELKNVSKKFGEVTAVNT